MKRFLNKKKYFFLFLISVFFSILIGSIFYGISILKKINTVDLDKQNIGINEETDAKFSNKGIFNIALFGIDAPDGMVGRSDAILIVTLNKNNNKIKLTSIMRDSYVNIDDHGTDKINHAYAFGGHELALKTLNENFDLNIKDFATVNFSSLPKIIDSVGGLELNIRQDEINASPGINDHIKNLNSFNNSDCPLITSPGVQHVNGTQALAYCRIRYTAGGDGERTERQRLVFSKLFEKLINVYPLKYPEVLKNLLPEVTTSLSYSDILNISKTITSMKNYNIDQARFPKDECSKGEMLHGVYYLVFDKEKTINQIHNYIFEGKN